MTADEELEINGKQFAKSLRKISQNGTTALSLFSIASPMSRRL
jgi:hypothetical protein